MNPKTKRKLIAAFAASIVGLPAYSGHEAGHHAERAARAAPADTAEAGREDAAYLARASKLIGTEVKNPQGEKLGEVQDLIVDVRNQTAHYAVLSFGGIAGIGDKLFAYPVSMLRWGPKKDELVLGVERSRLEAAPGFPKDNWPDWGVDSYRRGVDEYFKTDLPPKLGPNPRLMRASKLIGAEVDDMKKKHAGEIEDVVVSLGNGKVPYVVLDFDKKWSPDDKLMPIKLSSLEFPADEKRKVVLKQTREQLDMKRGFDEDKWPDLNDPAYRRDVEGYAGGRKEGARR